MYDVDDGKVYGGSDRQRTVKKVEFCYDEYNPGGYYPGDDFTMELDLSNRSFIMEINGEKIILDANIGDFQYSPIVIVGNHEVKITLL